MCLPERALLRRMLGNLKPQRDIGTVDIEQSCMWAAGFRDFATDKSPNHTHGGSQLDKYSLQTHETRASKALASTIRRSK